MSLFGEELREVLIHSTGDTSMLTSSQGRQLTTIAFCVLPDLSQTLTDILTQLRQVLLILELLVHPDIAIITRDPTRTMTTIVRDIEWFKALRGILYERSCLARLYRIGIINATPFLILGKGSEE